MSHAFDPDRSLPGVCERLRLDKWLWAARFYKTRQLACEDIDKGRLSVNGQTAKASRELKAGDLVEMRQTGLVRTVRVCLLSTIRGPAAAAQRLYEETPESLQRKALFQEARRAGVEPAMSLTEGRPTKRNRRDLAEWQRWSASHDEP